jgi:L-amino acid N-acyltransferase YncA
VTPQYVHHDFHRHGIRSRLLTELIDVARRKGLRSILANISADQSPSIRLHEKFRFQQVAHLHQVGQKFNQWFDAVYLQLLLAANKRPAVDAAGAVCLHIGGQWPSATQAERSASPVE